jgi:hypothetical protein
VFGALYYRPDVIGLEPNEVFGALYYRPDVIGLEPNEIINFINLPNPSGCTLPWGLLVL